MTSLQIVLSVASVLTTIAICYSTWSFNHWSRKRDMPDPVLAREALGTSVSDDGQVTITASLSFLNPGLTPIFIERIGIGLRGARGIFEHAWDSPKEVPSGEVRQVDVSGTWPRSVVCTDREAIIDTAFLVGCRAGELLISGLKVPRVPSTPLGEPASKGTTAIFVTFPGKPTPARYRVHSFTFPATSLGRACYWLARILRCSPSHRFARWCSTRRRRREAA